MLSSNIILATSFSPEENHQSLNGKIFVLAEIP